MKAIIFYRHGGADVLRYEDVDTPKPGPGMVLIEVGATSLNHGMDLMVREGRFGVPEFVLPHVGGSDPAGVVVELGEGVDGFAVGDRVLTYSVLSCGSCDQCRSDLGENYCRRLGMFGVHCWGGHSEYATVPARNLVPLPDSVSDEAATTLSIAYITAWHGLVARAAAGPRDTVLVIGAGSGIGAAAIQICALRGARVLATTGSASKHERARSIGADAVVDYRDPTWPQQILDATDGLGVSVLFDNIGAASWDQSLRCLGRAGRVVCSGATAGNEVTLDLRRLYRGHATFLFNANGSKADLAELVDLVALGALDPVIDSCFPLSAAARAHERLGARKQFGKIVLRAEQQRQPINPR